MDNVNTSHSALRHCQDVADQPLATREDGGTSIIVIPADEVRSPQVAVVQWQDVTDKSGHIVDVDPKGLLVAVVHVGSKRFPTNYSTSEVIVPRTGVTYTRARRMGRFAEHNELPGHWQWLMQMWCYALDKTVQDQVAAALPQILQEGPDADAEASSAAILESERLVCKASFQVCSMSAQPPELSLGKARLWLRSCSPRASRTSRICRQQRQRPAPHQDEQAKQSILGSDTGHGHGTQKIPNTLQSQKKPCFFTGSSNPLEKEKARKTPNSSANPGPSFR